MLIIANQNCHSDYCLTGTERWSATGTAHQITALLTKLYADV